MAVIKARERTICKALPPNQPSFLRHMQKAATPTRSTGLPSSSCGRARSHLQHEHRLLHAARHQEVLHALRQLVDALECVLLPILRLLLCKHRAHLGEGGRGVLIQGGATSTALVWRGIKYGGVSRDGIVASCSHSASQCQVVVGYKLMKVWGEIGTNRSLVAEAMWSTTDPEGLAGLVEPTGQVKRAGRRVMAGGESDRWQEDYVAKLERPYLTDPRLPDERDVAQANLADRCAVWELRHELTCRCIADRRAEAREQLVQLQANSAITEDLDRAVAAAHLQLQQPLPAQQLLAVFLKLGNQGRLLSELCL
eukprot:168655-Chlamydomonas_euryale.AAC.7